MTVETFEAAAMLAAYASETYNERIYDLAAKLALDSSIDAAASINAAKELTQARYTMSFEEWMTYPETAEKVERRVELQENFVAYKGIARRAASPAWCALTVLPLHKVHIGSSALAFDIKDGDGGDAMLKIPRRQWELRDSEPLQPHDMARFAEKRVRLLPVMPDANVEQLLAVSYSGTAITSRIPGRMLYKLGEDDLEQITDSQLLKAVTDLTASAHAGIRHDGNGSNTHYDPDTGFGFFDPLTADESQAWCMLTNIQGFGHNLSAMDPGAPRSARTPICRSMRLELFERLKALAPQAPADAEPHLADLAYKPDSFGY